MDFKKFLPWIFILYCITSIFGAFFKIQHFPFANALLVIGLLLLAFFLFLSIYEISSSKKLEVKEKFMWIMGLIFFGLFTGFLYVLTYRKKII